MSVREKVVTKIVTKWMFKYHFSFKNWGESCFDLNNGGRVPHTRLYPIKYIHLYFLTINVIILQMYADTLKGVSGSDKTNETENLT